MCDANYTPQSEKHTHHRNMIVLLDTNKAVSLETSTENLAYVYVSSPDGGQNHNLITVYNFLEKN
jgi:hypothetical protein